MSYWFCMGVFLPGLQSFLVSQSQTTLLNRRHGTNQSTGSTEQRDANMLHLLGVVAGLLFIIVCFSKGLDKANTSHSSESSANNKKKDLTEQDVDLLAKILSVGLVDADPNYLQHLKGYRDLRGT